MKKRKKCRIEYIVFIGLYLVCTGLNKCGVISDYLFQVIMLSGVNVVMAMSLNIVNGITGLFSIGHAGFMSIGAYISAVITTNILPRAGLGEKDLASGLIFLIALIVAGMAAAVCGFIIALPTLKVRGDYLAIVTLGFGELIRATIRLIDYVGGPLGMTGIPKLTNFTWIFVIVLLAMYASRNFICSTYGRSCLAIRENEIAAEAMGTDIRRYKTTAFTFSAFWAGIAGGLFAHLLMFISPDNFAYSKSTDILVYLYSGGVGTVSGAVAGGFAMTLIPELLRFLDDWRLVIYAIVLLYVIIWRPNGISGGREMRFLGIRTFHDDKNWIERVRGKRSRQSGEQNGGDSA